MTIFLQFGSRLNFKLHIPKQARSGYNWQPLCGIGTLCNWIPKTVGDWNDLEWWGEKVGGLVFRAYLGLVGYPWISPMRGMCMSQYACSGMWEKAWTTHNLIVLLCPVSLFYEGIEGPNIHRRNVSDVQLDNNDVNPRNQVLTSAQTRCFLFSTRLQHWGLSFCLILYYHSVPSYSKISSYTVLTHGRKLWVHEDTK